MCYGNGRSSVLEAASKLQAQRKGLQGIDFFSGGVPTIVRPGSNLGRMILDAAGEEDSELQEMLFSMRKKPLTRENLGGALLIPTNSYLLYMLKQEGVMSEDEFNQASRQMRIPDPSLEVSQGKFRTAPVLYFVGKAGEMDDAEISLPRKTAIYVEGRQPEPEEIFEYTSLNGGRFPDQTPEAYRALIQDCKQIAGGVVENLSQQRLK